MYYVANVNSEDSTIFAIKGVDTPEQAIKLAIEMVSEQVTYKNKWEGSDTKEEVEECLVRDGYYVKSGFTVNWGKIE